MPRGLSGRPLVSFDTGYYRYPTSVSRGYWSRYPAEAGLTAAESGERQEWLNHLRRMADTQLNRQLTTLFGDKTDYSVLVECLAEHGAFAERFFHERVRPRVAQRNGAVRLEPERLESLLSEARGHKNRVPASEVIWVIVDHLYEQNLLTALSEASVRAAVNRVVDAAAVTRPCVICGRIFRPVDLPDWAYFGSAARTDCCLTCPIVANPAVGQLPPLIRAFVEACGFIPNASAGPLNRPFTSRLRNDDWPRIMRAYGDMGGLERVRGVFGSWFQGLVASGVLPSNVLVTSRGIRCIARDGHVCHSLEEQLIDNWLQDNGIPHEREPAYPPDRRLNPRGGKRADWKAGGAFIEYFGLAGDAEYDRRADEKLQLAGAAGVDLIAVYPRDLRGLHLTLGRLLGPEAASW